MPGIYDLYIKNDIMESCEVFFDRYLKEEGVPHEGLTSEDRAAVDGQVDHLLDMITKIHRDHPDDYDEVTDELIDKLIGMVILGKMNEARLCRVVNECNDLLRDR
jgi:hypothetical protein